MVSLAKGGCCRVKAFKNVLQRGIVLLRCCRVGLHRAVASEGATCPTRLGCLLDYAEQRGHWEVVNTCRALIHGSSWRTLTSGSSCPSSSLSTRVGRGCGFGPRPIVAIIAIRALLAAFLRLRLVQCRLANKQGLLGLGFGRC